jgi:predicted permease
MIILVAVPAALLVVLACANVAHLLLAAAVERRREIGTRLALGASRGRVARQVLTESLAVGAVGGAAGLVLASWLVPWLASLLTSSAPEDPSPNLVVYAAAALFTVLVAMAAGLAPARLAWRSDVTSAVKTDRLGAPGGLSGGRLRAVLVGAQATASIVLLVVSALFVRSFLHVSGYAHGAHVDRLLNVTITFGRSDEAERATLLRAASDRIGRLAGVSSVSRATFPPFSDGAAVTGVARGLPNAQPVYRNFVDADYFDTISARVLQGRTFGPDEVSGEAPVAVITSALARAFWPAGDPIGSDLRRLWGDDDAADGSRTSWNRKPAGTRIVGVVEETTARLRTIGQATIYLPVSREVEALERLVVRAGSDVSPSFLVGPIHAALRALDPELSRHVEVVGARLSEELWPLQSRATVAGTVGASGLALAVMGLFAMTAYAVAQRRHELSVRVALGATGPQVVRMILRRSLTPVAIGLACGLGASVFADRLVRSWLIDIQPHDPLAIGAAVSILLVAALAAAFIPARHAARVEPVEMLRQS